MRATVEAFDNKHLLLRKGFCVNPFEVIIFQLKLAVNTEILKFCDNLKYENMLILSMRKKKSQKLWN